MKSFFQTKHLQKTLLLSLLVIVCIAFYFFFNLNFSSEKLLRYGLSIRTPKILAMILSAISIGASAIVFQSIVHNTIVTPSLLGMNSLYTFIHTAVVFFAGSGSFLAGNANISFIFDVIIMGITATIVYSYLFQKTNYNILYVLLVGTVLGSFFSSIQSTLVRVMDPNEYDSLLTSLIASFNNINSEIILLSAVLLVVIGLFLKKDLAVLDVIALGRNQAINLGVDYDRCVKRLLLGVALCISVSTAMVGPISFLGLVVANLSRKIFQTYRHTYLITGSALLGIFILIAGQLIVEQGFHYTIPVSVFINIGGGLYFLYLLMRERRS